MLQLLFTTTINRFIHFSPDTGVMQDIGAVTGIGIPGAVASH